MKSDLNILFVLDDNSEQYELFRMCVNTILKFNVVDNIIIVFYNTSLDNIRQVCSFISGVNIIYHSFDINRVDEVFPYLPNTCNERLRYPSLMRWFICNEVDIDYFWYIDTDMLFNTNIRDYFINIQNQKDRYFFAFNRKMYLPEEVNMTYYFHTNELNGGIIYINSKAFKENNMFNDIVNFYTENAENIYYMNQDGYQYLFDKYANKSDIQISDEYNVKYIENSLETEKIIKIFHFNGADKIYMYSIYEQINNREI